MKFFDRSGSAMIVAVIFTAGLAIAIATYLALSHTTAEASHRTFYRMAAFNLAESGVEHALWTFHQERAGENPWSDGWSQLSDGRWHFMTDDFTFTGGVRGRFDVTFEGDPRNPDSSNISVIAVGSVKRRGEELANARVLQADLHPSGGRGLFGFGMLARGYIRASGGVKFDSWISRPDGDLNGPYIPYSAGVARDRVGIATASSDLGAIKLGSSHIYGTAAVGSGSEFGLEMTWGGHLGPRDESEWDPEDLKDLWEVDGRKISYSTGAITPNFVADFEEVVVPSELMPFAAVPYVLPFHRDPNNTYVDQDVLGQPGMDTVLLMDSMTIQANATLTIAGNVTLILPRENVKSLNVIASGKIQLQDDASLVIYTGGDIEVSGAGILNQVAPEQLQVWGTASEEQTFDIGGSGILNGLVYAPNADVFLPGNTKIYGSIVANNITLSGSGSFHYDESLKDFQGFGGGSGPLAVHHIRELVSSEERAPYLELVREN